MLRLEDRDLLGNRRERLPNYWYLPNTEISSYCPQPSCESLAFAILDRPALKPSDSIRCVSSTHALHSVLPGLTGL